jgi:catechol 2,3-dioxygenase-like lactoylglutathione lyase family enzyme
MRNSLKIICFFICSLLLQENAVAQVKKVEAIGFTVSDMDRSVKFYTEVLQFKKISDAELQGQQWEKLVGLFGIRMRVVRLQLGDETIELVDYLTTGGRSIPEDAKSNDLSFQHIAIVVSDMDSAYHWLRKFNVPHVSTGPQTLPASIPAAAGIRAFYFQDPDKHNLEIIYFPKGKGQDKWQQSNGRVFLGIDHTAIGVSSSAKSHGFYQSILGIIRKGDSWNKGIEQEHLNNVEGASLHITGYRSDEGPGVEFLEYLVPGPGKKYPADTRTDDIWNWHTILEVADINKTYAGLKTSPSIRFISKEIVNISDGKTTVRSFMVRDPDGHALLIMEKKN